MIREVLTLKTLRAMDPRDAAAVWAARESGGETTASESDMFEQWLELDPRHAMAWADATTALDLVDKSENDELLAAVREHARNAGPERRFNAQRLVAGIVGLGLLASLSLLNLGRTDNSRHTPQPNATAVIDELSKEPLAVLGRPDFVTAKGEQRRVRLVDGTLAVLDTDSALDVAITRSKRSLSLVRGRVFFDVAHDAGRPFALLAGSTEIVALGTRFDVRFIDADVRLSLLEGRLAIARCGSKKPPTIINGGQRFEEVAGRVTVTSPANMDDVASWQRGYLTFNDATLASAAKELNRYGGDQLVVRDPQVANFRVTGVFKAGDAGRFARTVTVIHPVTVVRKGPATLELRAGG
jgi:transmembrane sensor